MDNNIVIHHVGGRAGSISFKIPEYFRNDFTVVLYEPDPDAIERIEQYANQHYGTHYVLPYCLDKQVSTKTLNINRDPNTSSLFKQNEKYKDYCFFQDGNRHYDYVWSETSQTIIEVTVSTTTLDLVVEKEHIPQPDIFCVDTQGSEYNIFEGSTRSLKQTVAIISEVEFSPLYANQPLFSDVSHLLKQHGFEFVYFYDLKEMSPMATNVASRGKGFHMYADALYIKSLEQIAIDFPNENEQKLAILKQVFFLICSGYVEMALKLMKKTNVIDFVQKNNTLKNINYIKFCLDFYLSANKYDHPKHRIPTFAETFSLDQSMQRANAVNQFSQNQPQSSQFFSVKTFLKNALKKVGPLANIVHLFNNYADAIAERLFIRGNEKNTGIEDLLIRHKLNDIASLIKENRLKCALGLYRNAKRYG